MEEQKKQDNKKTFDSLYKQLSKPIPKEFLISYIQDGKEFTGYMSQYAIDLLNNVVGLGNWHTVIEIRKEEFLNRGWVVAGTVTILISYKGQEFAVNGLGGSYAKDVANAYKGFKTSAFKNACRYLGIGKELYIQGFDEDINIEQNNTTDNISNTDNIEVNNELAQKIDSCSNLQELETLKDKIQSVDGKTVKDILIKKYNKKKLEIIEK